MATVNGSSLRKLPVEICLKIFRHVVSFEPGGKCPALLLALASEKDFPKEAQELSNKTSYVVTARNHEELKGMNTEELLKIHHLTMVWEGNNSTPNLDRLNLTSFKGYCRNNFETITMDLRGDYTSIRRPRVVDLYHELAFLIHASLPGVNRVVFVLYSTRSFQPVNNAVQEQMKDLGLGNQARVDGHRYGAEKWVVCYEQLNGRGFLG